MMTADADGNDLGRYAFRWLSVWRMKQLHNATNTGKGVDHTTFVDGFVVTCLGDVLIKFVCELAAIVQQTCKVSR